MVIDLYTSYIPKSSQNIIVAQIDPPPWGDGDPPWGDGDPPWGGGDPPWGDDPPPWGENGTPFSDEPPPWFRDGGGDSEESGVSTSVSPLAIIVVITLIVVVLTSAFYIQNVKKHKANFRIVHQLGKRRMLPKDEEELQIYKQWGYESHKNIPQWAYKIIHQRERASNNKITSGKISYKHIPKKLKDQRVIFCTYEKSEDRYYILRAYKLTEYDFIKGKEALKDIHNKIDIKSTLKTDPSKKKIMKFQIQMNDKAEKTQGDSHLDLIKQLLNQDENK